MLRKKLITEYNKKYKGIIFTVYNKLYTFGDVNGEGSVKILFDDKYTIYDIITVFEFIRLKVWDTTTYIRKQKLNKLLDNAD